MNRLLLCVATTTFLTACATAPLPAIDAVAPAQWQAPLPHQGQPSELANWWKQFNDPVLSDMQAAAQEVSSTLAQALLRIEQARATQVDASSVVAPKLALDTSAARSKNNVTSPPSTNLATALRAAWELDVFGTARAARSAAQARLQGAHAQWHEARVLVAAEVATQYLGLRTCEAQLAQTQVDATSRAETARLTELSVQAGVQAPANAALSRASAAQANAQVLTLRTQCTVAIKALVAITGLGEESLKQRLASGQAQLPKPAQLTPASVPAQVLNQRPDLYMAGREVMAASFEVSQAQAARFPKISLNGSLGAAQVRNNQGTTDGSTWSVGPVSITMPLLDGGVQKAQLSLARMHYDETAITYRAKVRTAVREVEEALVQLASLNERQQHVQVAVQGFDTSYRATQARYKGGLASLFELEDARRSAAQAQVAAIDLQRDQVQTWIALYRALGGGWSASESDLAVKL
jgi:outer membrane protein, multidrug efflux system